MRHAQGSSGRYMKVIAVAATAAGLAGVSYCIGELYRSADSISKTEISAGLRRGFSGGFSVEEKINGPYNLARSNGVMSAGTGVQVFTDNGSRIKVEIILGKNGASGEVDYRAVAYVLRKKGELKEVRESKKITAIKNDELMISVGMGNGFAYVSVDDAFYGKLLSDVITLKGASRIVGQTDAGAQKFTGPFLWYYGSGAGIPAACVNMGISSQSVVVPGRLVETISTEHVVDSVGASPKAMEEASIPAGMGLKAELSQYGMRVGCLPEIDVNLLGNMKEDFVDLHGAARR